QLRDLPPLYDISAAGNRLLCRQGSSTWKIFDVATGQPIAQIEGGRDAVLSGNGRLLLTNTNQRDDYAVWDVGSGRLLARLQFPAPVEGRYELRVSRDGRYAVCAGPGDSVFLFR